MDLLLYGKDFSIFFTSLLDGLGQEARVARASSLPWFQWMWRAKPRPLVKPCKSYKSPLHLAINQRIWMDLNWNVYLWIGGRPCGSSLFFCVISVHWSVLSWSFLFSCRRVMGWDVILADWVEPNTPTFLPRLKMSWAFDPATSYILEEPEHFDAQCQWKERQKNMPLGVPCFVQLSATPTAFVLQLPRFGKELEKIDIPKYRGNYIQYNAGNFSFWGSNWLESADVSSLFTFVLLVLLIDLSSLLGRFLSNHGMWTVYIRIYIYINMYIHTYITLHYITLHYITLHYITLHHMTWHDITVRYGTVRYGTVQYSTVQDRTGQDSTVQYIHLP